MTHSLTFKTQIALSDYPYKQDIEQRILLSRLSSFQVEMIKEILDDSLKIPVARLAENLDKTVDELIPQLDSLVHLKLFKREGATLFVNKEMRKSYEFHMEKFSASFEPNLEFIQSLLNQVPSNVLLLWYDIPNTSNNIFRSIIHECFITPKVYRQYLQELQFSDSILHKILKDLYAAPNFTLSAQEIMKRENISHEELQEYLIILEYHFVCCLRYDEVDGCWQEVVTPFAEWHEYLNAEKNMSPPAIENSGKITANSNNEFDYIDRLSRLLDQIEGTSAEELDQEEAEKLKKKLLRIGWLKKNAGKLTITEKGQKWRKKLPQDRAIELAINHKNIIEELEDSPYWSLRNLHAIEKSLRNLKPNVWVYLKDFLSGLTIPIGNKKSATLQKFGRKWKYVLPEYTEEELEFIRQVIMERCFELGIVMTGVNKQNPCFYLTQFGYQFIH